MLRGGGKKSVLSHFPVSSLMQYFGNLVIVLSFVVDRIASHLLLLSFVVALIGFRLVNMLELCLY